MYRYRGTSGVYRAPSPDYTSSDEPLVSARQALAEAVAGIRCSDSPRARSMNPRQHTPQVIDLTGDSIASVGASQQPTEARIDTMHQPIRPIQLYPLSDDEIAQDLSIVKETNIERNNGRWQFDYPADAGTESSLTRSIQHTC